MERRANREIYLDYAASTPCDPRVVEAMMPFLTHEFANPSSPHRAGSRSAAAIDLAREQVAEALGCLPAEIVFTSGATESNNLALAGSAEGNRSRRRRIITSGIEHKSVLQTCEQLRTRGYELTLCPVGRDGQLDLGALADLLDDETLLVSVQAANNEIGTLQPIYEVAQLTHRVGAIIHCDVAQAFGKLPVDVYGLELDLVSLSAHKCYGPKGVGALFINGGVRCAPIAPTVLGGGQEGGLRSGTPNVPGIVGLGEAARVAHNHLGLEAARVSDLRNRLEDLLCSKLTGAQRNGALDRRVCSIASLTIPGVDADALIANLPEICLSSSSACTVGTFAPSHVLTAIGLSREETQQTIRMGVGRFTTRRDIEYAGTRIAEAAQWLLAAGEDAAEDDQIRTEARVG